MLINNGSIKIGFSLNDNKNVIEKKIAHSLNTSPFWLSFENEKELLLDGDVHVIDILSDLKSTLNNYQNFTEVQAKYSKWLEDKQDDENAELQLAQAYILFFLDQSKDNLEFTKLVLENFFSDQNATNYDWNFVIDTIDKSEQLKQRIKNDIFVNSKFVLSLKTDNAVVGDYCDDGKDLVSIETSEISVESITTTLVLATDVPILLKHVLNKLDTSSGLKSDDNIILAIYEKYIKINKNFIELVKQYEYDYQNNSLIILQQHENKLFETVVSELSPKHFEISLDMSNEKFFDDEYISSLFFLGHKFKKLDSKNTNVKFKFTINTSFQSELLLDEIMNNPNMFTLYVNERHSVSKNISKLRISVYTYSLNVVTFTLSNVDGKTLVNVIKCSSDSIATKFKLFFTNLFKIYKSNELNLFDVYKEFFPNYELKTYVATNNQTEIYTGDVKTTKSLYKQLAEIEPKLFVTLYSRKCAKVPRMVNDDEYIDESKYQIMNFPVYNEGGLKPRKYVCDSSDKFIYPGLRTNTLQNKNTFKYIPCCYETDQSLRKGSAWNIYFNKQSKNEEKYEHSLYKTTRILPNQNQGYLPLNIQKIFPNANRIGVYVGPNAVIDAVARQVYYFSNFNDENFIKNSIKNIRKQLNVNYCLQENSDLNFEDVKSWFYDPDLYFEPRRFFRSLEEFFKVNVFWFEKSIEHVYGYDAQSESKLLFKKTQSANGIIGMPNTPSYGLYIDEKKYDKDVYLYLHQGSPIDSIEFPHCEYIYAYNNNLVHELYTNMLLFKQDGPTHFLGNESAVKKQIVDSSGRTVRLLMKSGKTIELKNPIQPLGVEWELAKLPTNNFSLSNSSLDNHIFMKRFTRVYLEYCMIKYANSEVTNVQTFCKTAFVIDKEFKPIFIADEYFLDYYDEIFLTDDNFIRIDSQDSINRIRYNLEKLDKINGKQIYIDKPYIENYFEYNSDFDGIVLNEKLFKFFLSDPEPGTTLVNSLIDLTNYTSVYLKDIVYDDLNGRFKVYKNESFNKLISTLHSQKNVNTADMFYIWLDSKGYKIYKVEKGTGLVVVVYKFDDNLFILVKS